MNVNSVLSLHNCSLSLVLYSTFYFTWKNSNDQMWTFIHWEDIRFWSSFLSLSATSHQGHGLITSAELKTGPIYSLKTLQRAACNLFLDLSDSGVPCLGLWNTLDILFLTYWGMHWQVFLEELWPHEIQIMSSEHCSSDKYPFYFPFLN